MILFTKKTDLTRLKQTVLCSVYFIKLHQKDFQIEF